MRKLLILAAFALLAVQGCERQSFKEDMKDMGQDLKNTVNKATD